ncbi:MAG: ABC transporter permease subunit [Deltaproteobacteria bacterium]|jgi:iron(III) transport system permease protein|nr:ABC transporter permease subunit [Deltaproteobacteria bacterium]MBT4638722.1 ABC transporter permease subunit [Deltaproteobacteria bacterium]MBT6503064.1 ABC transporter permease subunit [Deltaproteobacteria bacterium]MBT7151084.1 ABC transporter permease subunit [Deltaproteobacteria bacterium]MBT7716065.1 ABC transporter permease subunit [Deltaproteobacteria bacterium]
MEKAVKKEFTAAEYQVPALRMEVDRFIVPTVTIFIGLLLAFFLLYPLFTILQLSFFKGGEIGIATFTLDNFYRYFTTTYTLNALWHSLYVSFVTTVIVTVVTFFFAYAMTRTTIRGKTFFRSIIMMPLIAPSIMQALALIYLFGRNGLVTAHLFETDWNIYGATGIIVSEVLYCLPHSFVILFTTLSAVDIRLDEAAESLGASPFKVFWRVTLPSAKYGILSAAALTFNLTITDFGNPVVIGGNYNVLATEIYSQVTNLYRFDLGATISIILLVPSLAAFMLNYYISRRTFSMISGAARPFIPPSRRLKKISFTVYNSLISACIVLVFLVVILGSFVKVWPYDWSLTLDHFSFPSIGGYSAIWTSFWISVIVGIVGSFITLLASYMMETRRPFFKQTLYFFSVMPAAIPGLVMGLGYILAFNKPYFSFYGTAWIIVINIVICNFTLGVLSSISNLRNIDPSIEEASISLGGDTIRTFFKIIFPLSRVAFIQNFTYFFMRSMTTISAVIFLVSASVHLAAIEIIMLDNDGWTASANAMCTVIIAIVLTMLGLLHQVNRLALKAKA